MNTERKIYDCFIFYNELDLLELRLRHSYERVDHFVICEATVTFRGKPKPLFFKENRPRFQPFMDKIIHVVADDLPASESPWDREHFQRNCLKRGLAGLRAMDMVIVSDCDEIVSSQTLERLRREDGYFVLDMPMYQFYMNMRALDSGWRKPFAYSGTLHAQIGDYRHLRRDPAAAGVRFAGQTQIIEHAGWHFTFLGGADRIRDKLSAYSHTEAWQTRMLQGDNAEQQLELLKNVGGGRTLEFCEIDASFPEQVVSNLDHYIKIGYVKTHLDRIKELERMNLSRENTIRHNGNVQRYQEAALEYVRTLYPLGTMDLALNRPATQSSISQWSIGKTIEEDARRCNSGMIYNGPGCHTAKESNPWWEVDLGDVFVLSAVWLYNRPGELADRLRHFTLLGAVDGGDWQVLFQKTDDKVFGDEGLVPFMIVPQPGQPTRFLRIRLDGEDCLHFAACLVFGQPATAQPV